MIHDTLIALHVFLLTSETIARDKVTENTEKQFNYFMIFVRCDCTTSTIWGNILLQWGMVSFKQVAVIIWHSFLFAKTKNFILSKQLLMTCNITLSGYLRSNFHIICSWFICKKICINLLQQQKIINGIITSNKIQKHATEIQKCEQVR